MAGKGKKERREARFKDIVQDVSGNVVYTGELWRISGDDSRRQKTMLAAGLTVLIITVIGSGCIDAKNAMGAFFVVLPYIGEVSALFGLVWNAIKLIAPSEGVRTYVLDHVRPRIPGACRILTVFAVAGLILSALYMMLNGTGGDLADGIAYLLLKFAAAVFAEWYRRLFISIKWDTVK
jgi:hypothetical protein